MLRPGPGLPPSLRVLVSRVPSPRSTAPSASVVFWIPSPGAPSVTGTFTPPPLSGDETCPLGCGGVRLAGLGTAPSASHRIGRVIYHGRYLPNRQTPAARHPPGPKHNGQQPPSARELTVLLPVAGTTRAELEPDSVSCPLLPAPPLWSSRPTRPSLVCCCYLSCPTLCPAARPLPHPSSLPGSPCRHPALAPTGYRVIYLFACSAARLTAKATSGPR